MLFQQLQPVPLISFPRIAQAKRNVALVNTPHLTYSMRREPSRFTISPFHFLSRGSLRPHPETAKRWVAPAVMERQAGRKCWR